MHAKAANAGKIINKHNKQNSNNKTKDKA